jgi:ribose 5-phosphate isomerase A
VSSSGSVSNLAPQAHASENLRRLGEHALRYVKPGQIIGLGTGRAANAFIHAVAQAGLGICGVATSSGSAELARSLKIKLVELPEESALDADFDGADEVDPHLNLIKGRGGALVREKVVAMAARRRIFLVGDEKKVKRLGERGNLPIEVVPFAMPVVLREIARMGLKPKVRTVHDGGREFVTDNGNLVVDCRISVIKNPPRLECQLLAVAGVVGTGLFLGMADIVLMMGQNGKITTLRRPR